MSRPLWRAVLGVVQVGAAWRVAAGNSVGRSLHSVAPSRGSPPIEQRVENEATTLVVTVRRRARGLLLFGAVF